MRQFSLATRRSKLISSVSMLVFLLSALAAVPAQARDIRLTGPGSRPCSEWLDWKTNMKGEPRAMAIAWAQGFISAHNVYARNGAEPASSVVAEATTLATLLDNYCQKTPDARLINGVADIVRSLGGASVNFAPRTAAPSPAKPIEPGKGKSEI